ncbi:hypothetical protein GCM10027613_18400 [Microlunatus endophyticus]
MVGVGVDTDSRAESIRMRKDRGPGTAPDIKHRQLRVKRGPDEIGRGGLKPIVNFTQRLWAGVVAVIGVEDLFKTMAIKHEHSTGRSLRT